MGTSAKQDIQSLDDIAKLVAAFYAAAVPDPVIGHFFTEVVKLSWEQHIPLIVDFWSGTLLGEGNYRRNVMEAHQNIHRLEKIEQRHFDRWLQLWSATIEQLFEGPKSEEAKQRAKTIAQFMLFKLSSEQ